MKTTKTLTLIAAGKLAIGVGSVAHADDAKLGSKAPTEIAPKLGLFEIGYPLELLTPPTEGLISASTSSGSKNTNDANAQQFLNKGRIWTQAIPEVIPSTGNFPIYKPHPRIDFVVNNIRNDGPVTVYLLYGTKLAASPMQLRPNAGTFNLDLNTIGTDTHILAAVKLQPEEKIEGLTPSPIGKDIGQKTRSAVISIALTDFSKVTANEVYFQVAVVPDNGGIAEAQASEIDHFVIERVKADTANSGSKASKTSSSTIQNNDGSTTQKTCGKQGLITVCDSVTRAAPTQNTDNTNTGSKGSSSNTESNNNSSSGSKGSSSSSTESNNNSSSGSKGSSSSSSSGSKN